MLTCPSGAVYCYFPLKKQIFQGKPVHMEPRYVPENPCAICRFVENGDKIVIDVVERRIELLISEE